MTSTLVYLDFFVFVFAFWIWRLIYAFISCDLHGVDIFSTHLITSFIGLANWSNWAAGSDRFCMIKLHLYLIWIRSTCRIQNYSIMVTVLHWVYRLGVTFGKLILWSGEPLSQTWRHNAHALRFSKIIRIELSIKIATFHLLGVWNALIQLLCLHLTSLRDKLADVVRLIQGSFVWAIGRNLISIKPKLVRSLFLCAKLQNKL